MFSTHPDNDDMLSHEPHYEYDRGEELTGEEEHLRDSEYTGDARRCPVHPHVKTSSDDGMFDGLCGECEHGYDEELHEGPPEPPAPVKVEDMTFSNNTDEEIPF